VLNIYFYILVSILVSVVLSAVIISIHEKIKYLYVDKNGVFE